MTGPGLPALVVADGWRAGLAARIDAPSTQAWIIGLVVLNAAVVGLETVAGLPGNVGVALHAVDRALLAAFVLELGLKLLAHGARFFRSGWNLFDLAVIGVALVPDGGALSIFRVLRVLRVLRLVSAVPQLRLVVECLVRSLPGMGSIALLLGILYYLFAVLATKLFGSDFPQWFGSLWISTFSLFQIMTLEGWADIARAVMDVHPGAWVYFMSFILLSTFTVLNLFIGLIVKAMEDPGRPGADEARVLAELRNEIRALRREAAPGPGRRRPLSRRGRCAPRP